MVRIDDMEGSSDEDDLPPIVHMDMRTPEEEEDDDDVPPLVPNTGAAGLPHASFYDDADELLPAVVRNMADKGMGHEGDSDDDSLPPLVSGFMGGEALVSSDDDLPPVLSSTGGYGGAQEHGAGGAHRLDRDPYEEDVGRHAPAFSHLAEACGSPGKGVGQPPAAAFPGAGGRDAKAPPATLRQPQPVAERPTNGAAAHGPSGPAHAAAADGAQHAPAAAAPEAAAAGEEDAAAAAQDPQELQAAKMRILSCRRVGDRQKVAAALLECAELQIKMSRSEEALQGAIEARGIHKELFNGRGEAEALRTVVKVHWKGRRYTDAMHLAEEELQAFREAGDHRAEAMMVLVISDVHLAQEHYSMACQTADQALNMFAKADDIRGEAVAMEACINVYAACERWDRLIWTSAQAVEKLEDAGDTSGRASVLTKLSQAYMRIVLMDTEQALKAAKQANSLYKELGDKRGEAEALEGVASALLHMKDGLKEALRAVNKALAICKEIGHKKGEVSALLALANIWMMEEKYEEVMRAHKIALRAARDMGDQDSINDIIDIGINVHFANELPEKALALVDDEVRLARKDKNLKREAHGLVKMAKVKMMSDKATEAFRVYNEAVTVFQEAGDRKGEAAIQLMMCEAYSGAKQLTEALNAGKEAESLFQSVHDPRGVVHALQLQVTVYVEMKREEVALQQCFQQVKVFREAGFREDEASSQLGVAEMLGEYKGPREGLRAAKEARHLYKELGDKRGEASALIQVAMNQANSQAPTDALRSTNEATAIAKEVGDIATQSEALQVAAEIYLMQESFHEAIRTSNSATEACKEANDERQIAENSKKTAEVYLTVLNYQKENGRGMSPRYMKDALACAEGSRAMFDIIQDKYGEASALRMLSSLHAVGSEGEKALQAAQSALQICMELQDEQGIAGGYLCMAKANLELGVPEEALQYAHEAQTCYKQTGDNGGLESCEQVISAAEESSRKGPLQRSRSAGRNLGRNGRGPSHYEDPEEVGSVGSSPGFGSGNRSKSMPREELFSNRSPSSSTAGRYGEAVRDAPALPKSLNGFKGPQVGSVGTGGRPFMDEMVASAGGKKVLGFARGPGQRLGFGLASTSHLGDEDDEDQGRLGFKPHSWDLDQKRETGRGQQRLGASPGRRPLREVDGLD